MSLPKLGWQRSTAPDAKHNMTLEHPETGIVADTSRHHNDPHKAYGMTCIRHHMGYWRKGSFASRDIQLYTRIRRISREEKKIEESLKRLESLGYDVLCLLLRHTTQSLAALLQQFGPRQHLHRPPQVRCLILLSISLFYCFFIVFNSILFNSIFKIVFSCFNMGSTSVNQHEC